MEHIERENLAKEGWYLQRRGIWEKQDANLVWNAVGLYAAAYKCNRCGELNIAETRFCPNCGCAMEGTE